MTKVKATLAHIASLSEASPAKALTFHVLADDAINNMPRGKVELILEDPDQLKEFETNGEYNITIAKDSVATVTPTKA